MRQLRKGGSDADIPRVATDDRLGILRDDHLVATAEPLNSAGDWTVRIAPKAGEQDDIVWVKVKHDHVTSFGFHRRDKLRGYTGKSKKGASPGFCR